MRVNVYEHTGRRSFILNLANKFGGNQGNPTTKITASSKEKNIPNCFFFCTQFRNVHLTVIKSIFWIEYVAAMARPFKWKTTLKLNYAWISLSIQCITRKKKISIHRTIFASNVPLALEQIQKMAALPNRFTCVFDALTFRFIICVRKKKCACEKEKKVRMLMRAKARKKR